MPRKVTETIVELGRLNALTDGVYSIALTILAFGLAVPESTTTADLPDALVRLAPKLLVYLISFIVIGGAWGSHQRMFGQIKRGDGPLVWLNLLSLLFVTLLPAGSALLGRFPGELIVIVCFAVDVVLIQLSALWLWRHAARSGLLNPSLDPRVVRSVGRRLVMIAIAIGLLVALGLLNTSLVYAGWIALFVLAFTTDWLSWQQDSQLTHVAIPLDAAARGHIELLHGAGQLSVLGDGTGQSLLEGSCRGAADTRLTRNGDLLTARLTVQSGRGLMSWRYPWAWEMPIQDWDLRLNPAVPLAVRVEKASGEVELDFRRARVTDLSIEMGDGSINLQLPAGAGQGKVHIQAGQVALALHVPAGVAARIHPIQVQIGLEIDHARFPFAEDGKVYRSTDYETAENRIDIHLELGQGSVRIS